MADTFRIEDGVPWVGDREFRFAEADKEDHEYRSDPELAMRTRRMRIPAENGWTMSIIWGSCTYSDNYDHPHGDFRGGAAEWHEESKLGEIRIYGPDDRDALEYTVAGYLTTTQVLGLLELMGTWAADEDVLITDEDVRKLTQSADGMECPPPSQHRDRRGS
jgi:hypothetical protein